MNIWGTIDPLEVVCAHSDCHWVAHVICQSNGTEGGSPVLLGGVSCIRNGLAAKGLALSTKR